MLAGMSITRVYLSPGLFGFRKLAGLNYMGHVEEAVERRFRERDQKVEIHVTAVHPSASIRRRAANLVSLVGKTAKKDDGPIHLLGHSLGGLDVRLAASPSAHLDEDATPTHRPWLDRVCSATTLNTPHFGSPGGAYFITAQGQRLLYAVSVIGLAGLRLGSPPLAVTSALVAAFGRTHERSGLELQLIDRVIDVLQRALDKDARGDVKEWLSRVREDQAAVVQLMPEALDLFHAGVVDKPGLRYQCVATYAPPERPHRMLLDLHRPWVPLSAALFHLLYRVTSTENKRYPMAPPNGGDKALKALLGEVPAREANDGMVPIRSQLWGELVWAGMGDHLDVVGHFEGPPDHRDWLCSGSEFSTTRFDEMMDRVVEGMIQGEGAAT